MGERADYLTGTDESDPEVIVEDIEQTRADLTSTLEAIQDRLDPEALTDQAVGAATEVTEQARDAAKEVVEFAIGEAKAAVRELADQAGSAVRGATVGRVEQMATQTRDTAQQAQAGLLSTIKQHPIPAAMAAIGIGWLWTHRASGGQQGPSTTAYGGRSNYDSPYREYGSYRPEAPGQMGAGIEGYRGSGQFGSGSGGQSSGGSHPLEAAGQAVGQAQEAAGQAVGQVQETAGQVAGQVMEQTQQMASRVQDAAGQMPSQARGAFWQMIETNPMAVGALGAVVGGVAALLLPETEQENQLLGEARDRVMERVQEVASETVDKVEHVATEVGSTIQEAVAEVGETAAQAARDEGLTIETGGGSSGSRQV